jgi:hypothetical protein
MMRREFSMHRRRATGFPAMAGARAIRADQAEQDERERQKDRDEAARNHGARVEGAQ